jgi:hypothetical protein
VEPEEGEGGEGGEQRVGSPTLLPTTSGFASGEEEVEPPLAESKDGDTLQYAEKPVHPYYHYNELYTPNRRKAQVVLLAAELRDSMAAFNGDVQKLLDQKVRPIPSGGPRL